MKKIILLFLSGLIGYLLASFFNINPSEHIEFIIFISSICLSLSLFANVQAIDHNFIEEYKGKSIFLVSIGLLFKVILLGTILYLLTKKIEFFLIAALMSQIDPSFTNWAQRLLNVKGRIAKLTLIESTFDDPVSTLLTIYLALPFVLGDRLDLKLYSLMMMINLCFSLFFFLFKKKSHLKDSIISPFLVIIGGVFNLFLGVALSGLFFRIKKELFYKPIDIITYLSTFTIGLFIPFIDLDFGYGFLLAVTLVYVVRPIEIFIFFKNFNLKEKLVMSFAEQKGITTLLMLILIQPQINIINTVLPAVIFINSLFFINNYLVNLVINNNKITNCTRVQ